MFSSKKHINFRLKSSGVCLVIYYVKCWKKKPANLIVQTLTNRRQRKLKRSKSPNRINQLIFRTRSIWPAKIIKSWKLGSHWFSPAALHRFWFFHGETIFDFACANIRRCRRSLYGHTWTQTWRISSSTDK
jgi:hypothetical protein